MKENSSKTSRKGQNQKFQSKNTGQIMRKFQWWVAVENLKLSKRFLMHSVIDFYAN